MTYYMCKSKIHQATVTEANLHYEGSVTIDSSLMKAAGILPYERIQILNLNNGNRIETYVIEGKSGSGVICLNGPTARTAHVGDIVILITYALMDQREAKRHQPTIVYVDERNRQRPPTPAKKLLHAKKY